MTKRKRHIKWGRVLFLVVILAVVIGIPTKFILDKQAENRKNIHVTTIVNGVEYDLNGDEFIAYKTKNILPELELPKQNFDLYEGMTKEEFENDLARQEYASKHVEDDSEPKLIDLGEFRLTGYCNCEICCGVWAGGPCYNGEMPEAEWTIAVDKDVIPLNSYVMINGHKYKACDTGSAIIGNRIDIYCNTHQECYSDFCNGYAEVYLIVEEEVG